VHCCIPLWAEFSMLVFLMYVSLTFEDECSQGGDIETTPKMFENVLRKHL